MIDKGEIEKAINEILFVLSDEEISQLIEENRVTDPDVLEEMKDFFDDEREKYEKTS